MNKLSTTIKTSDAASAVGGITGIIPFIVEQGITKEKARKAGVEYKIPKTEAVSPFLSGGLLSYILGKVQPVATDEDLAAQEKEKIMNFFPFIGAMRLSRRLKRINNDINESKQKKEGSMMNKLATKGRKKIAVNSADSLDLRGTHVPAPAPVPSHLLNASEAGKQMSNLAGNNGPGPKNKPVKGASVLMGRMKKEALGDGGVRTAPEPSWDSILNKMRANAEERTSSTSPNITKFVSPSYRGWHLSGTSQVTERPRKKAARSLSSVQKLSTKGL